MKTLSLKQIFDSMGYTPAPLPPAESEVLDRDQAQKIITRFAEDDAAFLNFITGQSYSRHASIPLVYDYAYDCFNHYAHMPFVSDKMTASPEFISVKGSIVEIPSQPRLKIKLDADDISGRFRTHEFLDLIKTALLCRKAIEQTKSLSSDEVVDSLRGLSACVAMAYGRGLKLSDRQFDQIKNLALPANPVDPGLTDTKALRQIYVSHFQSETRVSKPMPRR